MGAAHVSGSSEESLREYALKRLHYNPRTGVFTWRDGQHAGKIAGSIKDNGYRYIGLPRRKYKASRLAYLMCFGEWPANMIDHRNRIRDDDRLHNLRDATCAENNTNVDRRKIRFGCRGGVFFLC
jgi:hypothetical protein